MVSANSPPVNSLMASAKASFDSISKLLVGSSCNRKNMTGAECCQEKGL